MRINQHDIRCPRCKSKEVMRDQTTGSENLYVCTECDFEFEVGRSKHQRHKSKHRQRGGEQEPEIW